MADIDVSNGGKRFDVRQIKIQLCSRPRTQINSNIFVVRNMK